MALYGYQPVSFFITLACYILQQSTRSEVQYFFVIFFSLSCAHLRLHTDDAQTSSCFQIQHESSEESIKKKKEKKRVKK